MSINLDEVQNTLKKSGFQLTDSTAKLVEYKSKATGRVIYVYKGQGFPEHADVIVHPGADASAFLAIPGVRKNRRIIHRFGSNMTSFPTRVNKGTEPEHFGRALYVLTSEALAELCKTYDA